MKKIMYLMAAAVVALAACEKTPVDPGNDPGNDPGKDPTPDVVLTLTSNPEESVGAESSIINIKFTTNAKWTAEVSDDFVVLNKESGEAGDIELKATVQSLPGEYIGRTASVTVSAGSKSVDVFIFQGTVFFVDPYTMSVDKKGGKVSFKVVSNLEYTVKLYNDVFDWAPATFNDETGEGVFTVAANNGYDSRSAYVKFTIPAIQDDVLDDDGNPTGETTDHVERIYLYQDGNLQENWQVNLPADLEVGTYNENANVTLALFDGKLLLCDGIAIRAFDPATGKAVSFTAPLSLPKQSITNDDAGNVLFAGYAGYGENLAIWAVKASDKSMSDPVLLCNDVVSAWTGAPIADNVRAKGDVFGTGMVSVLLGGGPGMGSLSYGMFWAVANGIASAAGYVEGPGWVEDTIWLSNRGCFAPAGANIEDGFWYSGYDGIYSLLFFDGTSWNEAAAGLGDWANAPNAIASTLWDGKNIVADLSMAYFANWGMPSVLYLFDTTNGQALSAYSYTNISGEEYVTGGSETSTADVLLLVEGDNLVVYAVDSSWGVLMKITYPKL